MEEVGKSFTKEERESLHGEGRLFRIFSSIKAIWKNLLEIRKNTKSFLNGDSRSFLK